MAGSPTQGDCADACFHGGPRVCHPPLYQVRRYDESPSYDESPPVRLSLSAFDVWCLFGSTKRYFIMHSRLIALPWHGHLPRMAMQMPVSTEHGLCHPSLCQVGLVTSLRLTLPLHSKIRSPTLRQREAPHCNRHSQFGECSRCKDVTELDIGTNSRHALCPSHSRGDCNLTAC